MNILVFDKGNTHDLLPTLTLSEVKCKCSNIDCTRTLILKSTIADYGKTRDRYGKAIRVNSGYRCQKHNSAEGGKHHSFHKIGAALDLAPYMDVANPTMDNNYQDELNKLKEAAEKHFDVVIRYSTFVHCHNYGDKYEE